MKIKLGVSPDIDLDTMGAAIDAALEATTTAQVPLLARGKVPDIRKAIGEGRVKWKPEPPGDEHFDDAITVLKRGWGDCDDLAPWHAAGLRATGEDPDARAMVYRSGPRRWHAVVERGDGSIDDPSRWAGMRPRGGGVQGIVGAIWPQMWPGDLGLAAYPYRGGWAGRVDLPDTQWPLAWSGLGLGPTPSHAVVGAIRSACRAANVVGSPREIDIARCAGIDSLLCGEDLEVVGELIGDAYGGEVGFLPLMGSLIPAATSLAAPLLGNILPGLGGQPPPAAAPPPPSGGGGGGGGYPSGSAMHCPGGPIIVRF